MEQPQCKSAPMTNLLEMTRRLIEKVKTGDCTADDLDEYFIAGKKYITNEEDSRAKMDLIEARRDLPITERSHDKPVSALDFREVTRRIKEKVKRGTYTADDLDEYFIASKKYRAIATKEDFHAKMDLIKARQDLLIAMMTRSVESISATNQQDSEASHPAG